MSQTGLSWPLSASVYGGGVNSSVYSRSAWGVELLVFDREDDARPARAIPVEPRRHRTEY
jgi:glycogen operon protein